MSGSNLFGDCSICFDQLGGRDKDTVALLCGHLFHRECASTWMKSSSSQGKCSQCRKTWRQVNSAFGTPSNPFGFVKIFVSGEDSSASDNKAKDVLGNEKLPASIKEAADRLLESNERLLEEIARVKKEKEAVDTSHKTVSSQFKSLQAMNNTLLSQAQQAKTAISSAAQELRAAQAECGSEKEKVKKLEAELVSHRSNHQVTKAIEDLDKGVSQQQVMKEMKSTNDRQTAIELEKVLYDREEKLRLVRQEKKSIHNDLLKEKERREKTEALATKLQKKLSEVSKMADPALIARAKEIIASNHSGSGSSKSSSRQEEEPMVAHPTAGDVTRSAHTPTHHGNQGHLKANTPPTISKPSFAASSTTALKPFPSGANKPRTVNHHLSNALKGRSLLSGNSSGNILSCDPDNGGTFLRTGPDGMGGLVTVRQASNVGFGATKRPAPNAHGVNPDAKRRKEQVPVKRATAVDAANFFGVAKQG